MRQIPLLLVLLSAATLAACGSDSSGGGGDDSLAALAGTWTTDCSSENDAEGDVESYKRDVLVISGSSFLLTSEFFREADTTCATLHYTHLLTATAAVGGDVAAVAGAKKIDIKPSKVEVTPATADAAAIFNRQPSSYCGITDWATGVKRDVSGKSCAGSLDTIYDIYKLDGKELVFGYADGDEVGSSSDLRPKTLDTAHVYEKS